MTGRTAHTALLDKVLNLTATLTDQVVDAQVKGRRVPGEQALALARSARLLQEYDVEWPPMLHRALHGLMDAVDGDTASVEKLQAIDE